MTYSEKLKDPRWQKKRNGILERDNYQCQRCGDTKSTLHVDHRIYRSKHDPWDYEDRELQTLCETCHQWVTDLRAEIAEQYLSYTNDGLGLILEVISAIREGFKNGDSVIMHEGRVLNVPKSEVARFIGGFEGPTEGGRE